MDISPYMDGASAFVGTTGSGKTYAAKGAVETMLAERRRVIIIDPTGAWYGLRSGADGKKRSDRTIDGRTYDGFPEIRADV